MPPYGAPHRGPLGGAPGPTTRPTSGLAQASSILGVLSVIGAVFVVTLPIAISAVILGGLDLRRARRAGELPARPAVLGVLTGLAGTLIAGGVLAYLLTRPGFGDYWRCLRGAGTTQQMRDCLSRFTNGAP